MFVILLGFFVGLLNGQITQYFIPENSTEATATVIYSFGRRPNDPSVFLFDIRVTANKWVGFGFADSSGTTQDNLFMTNTYAWIFANFDHATTTSNEGEVKEYYLGNRMNGISVWPAQITTDDSEYSFDDGSTVTHTVQIFRPYSVDRAYQIPNTGRLCLIWAVGNEWNFQDQFETPVHESRGYRCHEQAGDTGTPTMKPSYGPTQKPTQEPTLKPTNNPTAFGKSDNPTKKPSRTPSRTPSGTPSMTPTKSSNTPTKVTVLPTEFGETFSPTLPSQSPTLKPSFFPTKKPTAPTAKQITGNPSLTPTIDQDQGIIDGDDDDPQDQLTEDGGLSQELQILIVVGGAILLLCCFIFVVVWYVRSKKKREEKQKKRHDQLEKLAQKQAEIYVAEPHAKPSTQTDITKPIGEPKKKRSKYDTDSDDDSDDDVDDEIQRKYGKYLNDDDDDDSDDSYQRSKRQRAAATKVKSTSAYIDDDDDDDDDDDSDSDIPPRYKAPKKSKFAAASDNAKSTRQIIKNKNQARRRNKYDDSDEDY